MNKDFVFEVEEEDEAGPASQSPWEFSAYSHTVAEEHLQRGTSSIDDKILRAKAKKTKQQPPQKLGRSGSSDEQGNAHSQERSGVARRGHENGVLVQNAGRQDSVQERSEDDDRDDNALVLRVPQKLQNRKKDRKLRNSTKLSEIEEDVSSSEISEGTAFEDPDMEVAFDDEGADRIDDSHKSKISKKKTIAKEREIAATFFSSDEKVSFHVKTFLELNISRPLLRACEALGYKQPTPIQAACIPLALTGRDICGSAVTGSGKTAAFALPLLERLLFRPKRIAATRVLILTPTRELAVQVYSMIEKLAQFTDIRCCLVVGGLSIKVQEVGLRSHPDIVVATPGRMIDHLHNTHSVGLEDLAILILDEADRLLELGFSTEVQELVRLCPKKRQTMLFSATMTEEVNDLVKLSLVNPVRLSADPSTQRPATLMEQVVKIRPQHEGDKEAVLLALCSRTFKSKVIIFSGTKLEAHRLKILFGLSGLRAGELHGNLTQAQRLDALELFKRKDVDFLISTDVAARGLDIIGVETVINFECPRDITTYVHRVGRTARAGQHGCAVTFVTEKDRPLLKVVAKRAGSRLTSRVVPVSIIMKWHEKIVDMETLVRSVIQEERAERALRKAEMEANKAQNLMDHEAEIFSRPKKVWFQSSREKRQSANAAKAAKLGLARPKENSNFESPKNATKDKNSKRKSSEHEKTLSRKKRRRLEAAQEAADEFHDEQFDGSKATRPKAKHEGNTIAQLAYRRAKAVKAIEKARLSGKMMKGPVTAAKKRSSLFREKKKKAEMEDLFQNDMTKSKGKANMMGRGRKPGIPKRSFKSKGRYKRR